MMAAVVTVFVLRVRKRVIVSSSGASAKRGACAPVVVESGRGVKGDESGGWWHTRFQA